tara:strand:- start:66 stop:581 length:516 start_codon:yes stop_codon:yes gene_type:complete
MQPFDCNVELDISDLLLNCKGPTRSFYNSYDYSDETKRYIFPKEMVNDEDFTVFILVMIMVWELRIYPSQAFNYVKDEPTIYQYPDEDTLELFDNGRINWLKKEIENKEERSLSPYTITYNQKSLTLSTIDPDFGHEQCNYNSLKDELIKLGADMNQKTIVLRLQTNDIIS